MLLFLKHIFHTSPYLMLGNVSFKSFLTKFIQQFGVLETARPGLRHPACVTAGKLPNLCSLHIQWDTTYHSRSFKPIERI